MGKQIQIFLSEGDELRLIEFLAERLPVKVVNSSYPSDWDHRALVRTSDERKWIILDTRVEEKVLKSAYEIYRNSKPIGAENKRKIAGWQIASRASNCIEWSRDYFDDAILPNGRLYVNTYAMGTRYSTRTAELVNLAYRTAAGWIRRNCVNCGSSRFMSIWVSKDRVEEFRKRQDARRVALPKDPRDEHFYELHRKKKSKLTKDELDLYISYCEKMMLYVAKAESILATWRSLKNELEQRRRRMK